jgi:hypothetical protein
VTLLSLSKAAVFLGKKHPVFVHVKGWGLFRFRDFTKRIEERNTKVLCYSTCLCNFGGFHPSFFE